MSLKRFIKKVAPIATLGLVGGPMAASAGLAGGLGGGTPDAPAPTGPGAAEMMLADISKKLFEEGDPLRKQMYGQFGDVMSGNFDPMTSPMFSSTFATGKKSVEDQYGLAKDNILSSMPRGGSMGDALQNVELARAEQASSLPAMISEGIMKDMMTKAYGSVFPTANPITGLSSAAGIEANRDMSNQQIQAQYDMMQQNQMNQIFNTVGQFLPFLAFA